MHKQGAGLLGRQARSVGEHKCIPMTTYILKRRGSNHRVMTCGKKLGKGTSNSLRIGHIISQQRPVCPRSHLKRGHVPCQRESVSSLEGLPQGAEPSTQRGHKPLLLPNHGPELVTWPHPNSPGWGSAILSRVWKRELEIPETNSRATRAPMESSQGILRRLTPLTEYFK